MIILKNRMGKNLIRKFLGNKINFILFHKNPNILFCIKWFGHDYSFPKDIYIYNIIEIHIGRSEIQKNVVYK